MFTKTQKIVLSIATICLCLSIGISYHLYKTNFYKTHFANNSEIMSIDVSKLTVNEAFEKVENELPNKDIEIKYPDREYKIKLNDVIQFTTENVQNIFNKKPLDIKINDEILLNKLNELHINENASITKNAFISKENNEFIINKEINGDNVNIDELNKIIVNDLSKDGKIIYNNIAIEKPTITSDSEQIKSELNNLHEKEKTKVTLLVNGEKIEINQDDIKKSVQPQGIDTTSIRNQIQQIDDENRTKNNLITFTTHNGEKRDLWNESDYGWQINIQDTLDKIAERINQKQSGELEAIIDGTPSINGTQFGGNYAEVDLNAQKAYIFEDGKPTLEWDVITGMPNSQQKTTPGVYTILYTQSPSTLRGTNLDGSKYEQPVSYWGQFTWSGIGFHDANWQYAGFGGDKYKTLGSHGCVNTPPEIMPAVYSKLYAGMPVIVWGDIYNGL